MRFSGPKTSIIRTPTTSLKTSIKTITNLSDTNCLEIQGASLTDAWCLASELRSGDAMLEVCDNCKCTYFTSVNQRTCVECPFCKEQGRHGGGEKECA
ncbi:hypothetical protein [Serratia nevei]|uniref:hypothetical protein n=1 Tax=Serratia nevei TaxID=2703794 RepID=UPI00399B1B6B